MRRWHWRLGAIAVVAKAEAEAAKAEAEAVEAVAAMVAVVKATTEAAAARPVCETSGYGRACVCACVRACVRARKKLLRANCACVPACVCAKAVRACVHLS